MARLRRQWGLQSRWTADGPDAPWSEPWWAPSREAAVETQAEVLESYQRRLVSRIVSDVIVEPKPTPPRFAYVDKVTHEPCPTAGNALCTLAYTDASHRHVAQHMLAEG